MFKSKKTIGLDITGRTFRAVAVITHKKHLSLEGYSELTVSDTIIQDGVIKDKAKAAAAIRQLVDALPHHLRTHEVHVALPETKTFIKLVEFPTVAPSQLENVVNQSITQHIPFPIDEVYYDWKVLQTHGTEARVRVLVGAVEKVIADDLVSMLQLAGFKPLTFAIESIATAASLIDSTKPDSPAIMIVDIGSEQSTAILYDQGTVQFSSAIDFSEKSMRDALISSSKLKPSDAEKAKRIFGLDPKKGKGRVRKILLPLVHQLAKSIEETSQYYINGFTNGRAPEQILLVGSGSNLGGITEYLSDQLHTKVDLGDPVKSMNNTKIVREMTPERRLEFATAIGLTLSIAQK